jgi:hypothetical protein
MAKKKTTTNFDPGRFRMGEEASMATIPQTPLQQLQKSTQVAAIDPYYVKDPITGLSPAQVEARAAQAEAQTGAIGTATQLGLTINPKTGMINPPATGTVFNPTTGKFEKPAGNIVVTDPNAAATAAALAAQQAAQLAAEEKRRAGQSAFTLLKSQFDLYGLGDLVSPLEELISEGISAAEMTLKLRNDPKYNKAYKIRFAANDARIAKGLRALSEAEYIGLEDGYQNIMVYQNHIILVVNMGNKKDLRSLLLEMYLQLN